MCKFFRASLVQPFEGNIEKLKFSKNQIVFPKRMKGRYVGIKNKEFYTLIKSDNIDRRLRYEIKIGNNNPIRLNINRFNVAKLKWVHGLTLYHNNKIAYIALIVAILSLILSVAIWIVELRQ